jgi:GntR family transcriptional regulator of vanillate catabolism
MSLAQDGERAQSQTVKALLSLRELILAGALRPRERISELAMVDRLGVSRTPLRTALVKLEQEGLIEEIPSGGYAARAFAERDIFDAIEIRGTLEGLAARFAAERGVPALRLSAAKDCVSAMDEIVEGGAMNADAFARYVPLNARFHALLLELADSEPLRREVERATRLPFASPSGFVKAQAALPESHRILTIAQEHHRAVVDAIQNREGARAEAIMREHARLAHRNLQLALRGASLDLVPGAALIRRAGE